MARVPADCVQDGAENFQLHVLQCDARTVNDGAWQHDFRCADRETAPRHAGPAEDRAPRAPPPAAASRVPNPGSRQRARRSRPSAPRPGTHSAGIAPAATGAGRASGAALHLVRAVLRGLPLRRHPHGRAHGRARRPGRPGESGVLRQLRHLRRLLRTHGRGSARPHGPRPARPWSTWCGTVPGVSWWWPVRRATAGAGRHVEPGAASAPAPDSPPDPTDPRRNLAMTLNTTVSAAPGNVILVSPDEKGRLFVAPR